MVEPEIAFAGLDDICSLSQNMLRYLCQAVLTERADDMEFFQSICRSRLPATH